MFLVLFCYFLTSLAHVPLSLKMFVHPERSLCMWMDRPVFLFDCFVLKKRNPVDCLVWESSQFPECSCLLTEDPQSETPSQHQCLCQRACKHLLYKRFCSTWLWIPSNAEEEVILLKTFLFIFVHFKCKNEPPTLLQVQLQDLKKKRRKKKKKRSSWYIFGRCDGWLIGKLNPTPTNYEQKHVVSSLSWRAIFECASVFMIKCWFFFSFLFSG